MSITESSNVLAAVSEYEKTLVLPSSKPRRQYIICPVGIIGSGKTTLLKLLAPRLPLIRLSNDELKEVLHKSDLSLNQEEYTEIATYVFRKYLDLGYSIAADWDCASPKTEELLYVRQKEYGLKLIWIHINPPEEFILRNLSIREPSWLFNNREEVVEHYYQRKAVHTNLKMPFTYTFNPSLDNFEEQIEEAVKVIEKETSNN